MMIEVLKDDQNRAKYVAWII